MTNERSPELRHEFKWNACSTFFREHFVQSQLLLINITDNFENFKFGQTTITGVQSPFCSKKTKCFKLSDKLKVILCHLFVEIHFPLFQCVLFASQLPSLSIFYVGFVCLFGPLSTSPVDSDLRWTLIRLDLSWSQGQGPEIGLSSDWKVWPWGKGTREVKKKTILSFGLLWERSSIIWHAPAHAHSSAPTLGRLQFEEFVDPLERSAKPTQTLHKCQPREADTNTVAVHSKWAIRPEL